MTQGRGPTTDGFPLWRVLGGLTIIAAIIAIFILWPRGDVEEVADLEAPYEGVHNCSKDQQASATAGAAASTDTSQRVGADTTTGVSPNVLPASLMAPSGAAMAVAGSQARAGGAATPAPASTPSPAPTVSLRDSLGGDGCQAPFFSQTCQRWGGDEYDHGARQDIGCGATIAQCGCAMTSMVTVMAMYGVLTNPDGGPLNPQTFNDWLNEGSTLTGGGWVSQGYAYGGVVWVAMNAYTAEVAAVHPGSPTVRFKAWGTGSEEEMRGELEAGRPMILEAPGHFIAAVGLEGSNLALPPGAKWVTSKGMAAAGPVEAASGAQREGILLNDPYYRDRISAVAYPPSRVLSSRTFEASGNLRAAVFTAPSNLDLKVTNSRRRVTSISREGQANEGIPGSDANGDPMWRDPTCEEPPPDGGVNQIFIPNPGKETFQVEVTNPEGGGTTVAVHTVTDDGVLTFDTFDAAGDNQIKVDYDPQTGADTTPTPTPTGAPTPTGTPTPTATRTGAKPPPSATFAPEPPALGVTPRPGDRDGDGILDGEDRCPGQPEDKDGFADYDGCLDPDNDGDGILDGSDVCPMVPEDYDGDRDDDGCPDTPLDPDGDGIGDIGDACPDEPEDLDGFQDADGCPDPDNDGDGILDVSDSCPNEPEDFDGCRDEDGCPDVETDGDCILDTADACPDQPEDFDGFQDEDGCPDPDNDGDGIPDASDACPNQPEDFDGFQDADGCPDPDNDGDGIPDITDVCPNAAETVNGCSDADGCPDSCPPIPPPLPLMSITAFTVGLNPGGPPWCAARITWTVTGDPAGTVTIYRGGSPVHSEGASIGVSKSWVDDFGGGCDVTWRLEARNSAGQVTQSAPITMDMCCIT